MLLYLFGVLFLAPIIFPVTAALRWGVAGGVIAGLYAAGCVGLLLKKPRWGIFPYLVMCVCCIYWFLTAR